MCLSVATRELLERKLLIEVSDPCLVADFAAMAS